MLSFVTLDIKLQFGNKSSFLHSYIGWDYKKKESIRPHTY